MTNHEMLNLIYAIVQWIYNVFQNHCDLNSPTFMNKYVFTIKRYWLYPILSL